MVHIFTRALGGHMEPCLEKTDLVCHLVQRLALDNSLHLISMVK